MHVHTGSMSCLALTITNTMAAASMFAKLSDKLANFVCGVSPTAANDGGYSILSPSSPAEMLSRRRSRGRSWSSSSSPRVSAPDDGDNADADDEEGEEEEDSVDRGAMSPPRVGILAAMEEQEESTAAPCLAFASQDGYKVISLLAGDTRAREVPLRPVLGRRVVPSPYGGTALATDVCYCYRHPCHLVDPFTGARAALPDLPVPRSETEPVPCEPHEPRAPRRAPVATDDGLAWDWSPRGVLVARGDTAFFCALDAGEKKKKWEQVHQAAEGSTMTVNHRGGRFFLLELRTLKTTVIDAATLRVCAVLPPPPGGVRDVDAAYLAPSSAACDEALMLLHRAGDRRRGTLVTEAFRARLNQQRRRAGGKKLPPRWARVDDVGDRAVFVDGAHAFTVRAGHGGHVLRNRVYMMLAFQVRGRRAPAAAYDVAVVDLRRPDMMERLKLDAGEVERAWGWQPFWIIPKDGPDPPRREEDQSAAD